MAASWTLPLASFVRGNVGIGVIGPFFGSARLSMLVMEKLVYAEPVDVLPWCSGGVFGGLSLESALWLNVEWRWSCCCCCCSCVEYWYSFRDMLWSSGRGDGSGLDTTLISTSTSCEDIFFSLLGKYRFIEKKIYNFFLCVWTTLDFHQFRLLIINIQSTSLQSLIFAAKKWFLDERKTLTVVIEFTAVRTFWWRRPKSFLGKKNRELNSSEFNFLF